MKKNVSVNSNAVAICVCKFFIAPQTYYINGIKTTDECETTRCLFLLQLLRSALTVSGKSFRVISSQWTRLTPNSAAAFPLVVVEESDGAGRMNASAESTGMGFYKAPAAVGGARQLDATNQFANPRSLHLQHSRFSELSSNAITTRVTGWKKLYHNTRD